MFGQKYDLSKIPVITKGSKVAIVTGANIGIGYHSALELARKGYHVFLACRSEEKALPAVQKIKEETQNDLVEFLPLNLSSLASVKAFSDRFHSRDLPLHLLLNNAGVMVSPFALTEDGIENQFGVNHVGHFYLTMLLLDRLEASQPSRIVNVSSEAHRTTPAGGIDFEHINDEKKYNESRAYGRSKLANILFTKELAARLEGKQIYVNCNHPGVVDTELWRHVKEWGFLFKIGASVASTLFFKSAPDGALTQLYLSLDPEIEEKNLRGRYFVPYGKEDTPTRFALDEKLRRDLWEYTEKVLKEKLGEGYVSPFPGN